MKSIQGKFSVDLAQLDGHLSGEQGMVTHRMAITKHYDGILTGDSKGEMLSVVTPFKGSAGYVAIEQFTGLLDGRQGSFVLQHSGIMNRGDDTLQLQVVPDSGTNELEHLVGTMQIHIADGTHTYLMQYDLPPVST